MRIEPACDVIETGLLWGDDATTLTPVGQPIYGQRAAYRQEIPIPASGRYWLAAYARDEAGTRLQAEARPVLVILPPPVEQPTGSHAPGSQDPASYAGTNVDFRRPAISAGDPRHFASLRSTMREVEQVFFQPGAPFLHIVGQRVVSSTHRDEVRIALEEGIPAGATTVPPDPEMLNRRLDGWELFFERFPRRGLYRIMCEWLGPPSPFASCFDSPQEPIILEYHAASDRGSSGSEFSSSSRADFTYFIPGTPQGQQLQSATLLLRLFTLGDFSALSLSGKPPVSFVPLGQCELVFCHMLATWDLTREARSLSAQGGGELQLTLDPIPPVVSESPFL